MRSRRIGGRPCSVRRVDWYTGFAQPRLKSSRKRGHVSSPGPEENRVRMRSGFVGQRRHVQSAKRHVRPSTAVVIGEAIRAMSGRDVDLNDDKVRRIIQIERLHVLILNLDVRVVSQVGGQRGQAQRREQRVFDRTPVGPVASVSAGRIILTFIGRPRRR